MKSRKVPQTTFLFSKFPNIYSLCGKSVNCVDLFFLNTNRESDITLYFSKNPVIQYTVHIKYTVHMGQDRYRSEECRNETRRPCSGKPNVLSMRFIFACSTLVYNITKSLFSYLAPVG